MGADNDWETRVHELERQLRETSRRLEETQSLARVGSWEWELPARQAKWSRELLRTFGRDPDGPPPTRDELLDAIHPEDRADFEQLIVRIESRPGPFGHGYRIVDADGEIHHMQARGYVEAGEHGRPVRTHGTTQDITELKESQAQLERARRLEAVGQLAGGVAHDFNNLLSVILNYAEYVADSVEDEETRRGLREIERAALSGADLTRQLLLFSRRGSTEMVPVDLGAVVAETEKMLRRTIGDHIELTVDARAGLPSALLAEGEAQQILLNLAVNARDALPEGGTIAVSVAESDGTEAGPSSASGLAPGVPRLQLTVADDGIGMSEEVAAQAFDPFFTTKARGKGTGLGLATVYGIATKAGGHVEIESEPGRGTAITVHLPLSGEPRDLGAEPSLTPSPEAGQGHTVLVVDNEAAVRTVVCHMLRKHGYGTRAVASGEEAEALLAERVRVDLLLTDLLMPGMSGKELAARVQATHPGMPTVYMSGYAAGEDLELGPRDESTAILLKPFTSGQLLAAIDKTLPRG